MKFDVKVVEKCLIIKVDGEIDHHSAAEIKGTVVKEYSVNMCRDIIFDFSALTFMDSAGVGMLIGRYKQVCINEGIVIATGIKPCVERIFELSGLNKIIRRCNTVEEALNRCTRKERGDLIDK